MKLKLYTDLTIFLNTKIFMISEKFNMFKEIIKPECKFSFRTLLSFIFQTCSKLNINTTPGKNSNLNLKSYESDYKRIKK